MTIELTVAEKTDIINQHVKNLELSRYNAALSLVEANAATTPNQSTIQSLNNSIADIDSQISALNTALTNLQ